MTIDTSIIISTYNSPEWLKKVLFGYNNQTYRQFEVVIADDGSSQETFDLIQKISEEVFFPIIHVWHEDDGFQKTKILNKAILKCSSSYIMMSDGDCIPRADFVEQHVKYRQEGYFLSGGYFKLTMPISKMITKEHIYNGDCFNLNWLKQHGLKSSFKNNKLTTSNVKAWFLNLVTPTKATWNGHNASAFKDDILAVNGFDERMKYGGEDREMGERLMNNSIKPIQLRYTAICVHLDHSRGYVNEEALSENRTIRDLTKAEKKVWTEYGIVKSR